jgi:two-component system, response regulator, stage 0 sporulation protein F
MKRNIVDSQVLYVDDEDVNLFLFEQMFKEHFSLKTAISGKSALEVLDTTPEIGIIFSDMRMPVMNGIEFIKKARKRFPNKTYYILTGYSINDEIRGAISEGLISKYFQKPFDVKAIVQEIESV